VHLGLHGVSRALAAGLFGGGALRPAQQQVTKPNPRGGQRGPRASVELCTEPWAFGRFALAEQRCALTLGLWRLQAGMPVDVWAAQQAELLAKERYEKSSEEVCASY
jgi:hypothetical protein